MMMIIIMLLFFLVVVLMYTSPMDICMSLFINISLGS